MPPNSPRLIAANSFTILDSTDGLFNCIFQIITESLTCLFAVPSICSSQGGLSRLPHAFLRKSPAWLTGTPHRHQPPQLGFPRCFSEPPSFQSPALLYFKLLLPKAPDPHLLSSLAPFLPSHTLLPTLAPAT